MVVVHAPLRVADHACRRAVPRSEARVGERLELVRRQEARLGGLAAVVARAHAQKILDKRLSLPLSQGDR